MVKMTKFATNLEYKPRTSKDARPIDWSSYITANRIV